MHIYSPVSGRQAGWTDVDAPDDVAAVCHKEAQKQSTCPPHNPVAMARSVLEKLIRLSLTNQLSDDQTKAVLELGNQLFQSPGPMTTPSRTASTATRSSERDRCDQPQSETSLLADTVVQRTVSRVRGELADEDAAATAVQRRSTASMLADTVVQQTLTEINKDLTTSDILSPKAVMPDSTTALDKAVQVAQSSSSTGAACPPEICTELTKYIVMNAIDIALSCARRTAAKRAESHGQRPPGVCVTPDSNLIDAFIDLLSSEVYGSLSVTARQPTSDAVLAVSRWIDDDLRRLCLASAADRQPMTSPPPLKSTTSLNGVSPFAEVLMNLALHDRLGDLQKNFVDGREMIDLATRVLKSHVQSRSAQHILADAEQSRGIGIVSVGLYYWYF